MFSPRSLLRSLYHMPDRLKHGARRREAESRISARTIGSVLMVCHGNVCRSPYAAARLSRLVAEEGRAIRVVSAGFIGPNRPSPPELIELARGRGLDLTDHRSQLLSSSLAKADLVVVMNVRQAGDANREFGVGTDRILILDEIGPGAIDTREIRDPWGQPLEVYEQVMARLDRCVKRLAELI
ncbi:MAG: hypothetical protein ABI647_12580 [Gemmatimonadota bacterium]